MFFSGDHSGRKRVDLGGRSSKERDRQVLLEQTRLERKRRQDLRQQTAAAVKIQKCFRGRRAAHLERSNVRVQFHLKFGDSCQNVDGQCFNSDSEFLPQLLFFFTASNDGDVTLLVEACRLLLHFVRQNVGALSSHHYSRVLVQMAGILALYQNYPGSNFIERTFKSGFRKIMLLHDSNSRFIK